MTDKEIKREKTFEEELPYFKERIKEVFDNYHNPNGNEDTLEICVLRQSNRIIKKAEKTIASQQAEIENYSCNIKQLTSDHITLQHDFDNVKSLYKKEKTKVEKLNQKLIDTCKRLHLKKTEAIKEVLDEITEILHEAEMHGNYEPSLTIEIINDIKKKMGADNE